MGLFGELDATDVPDNPFYVAPGTYPCVLAEVARVTTKDGTKEGIAFRWVIEDEDSEFNNQRLQDWKNIYPDLTADEVTPQIKRDMSNLRQLLLSLNLTDEEQNDFLDNMEELVGTHAMVTVRETSDKHDPDKKYTNVTKVSLDLE